MFKDPKAIKKALLIAQNLATKIDPAFSRVPMPEIAKASGGDVDDQDPSLIGSQQDGTRPVFYSKSAEMLNDPASMNQMKLATPYKWNKELRRYGVKNEELGRMGLDLASNEKMSRDQLLNLARSATPNISEKILGRDSGKNVADNIDLIHGEYETIPPDSSYLQENANDALNQDLKHEIHDPNWWPHDEHMNGAIESYLDDEVPAIKDTEPHRLQKFLDRSVKNGWIYPDEAEKLSDNANKGFADEKDWQKILSYVQSGVSDGFNDKRTLEGLDHPSLFEAPDDKPKKIKTHDYLKELEGAVHDVAGKATPVMEYLKDYLSDRLQDHYYREAEENYYDDTDRPQQKTITASHNDGDHSEDYEIHSTYEGYDVYDSRGRRVGETGSEDEAEALIRNHFAKKIDPDHDRDADAPREGGRRQAPLTVDDPLHAQYALPGLKDYREHLIHFKPESGTFDRGHYDPNTLAHVRYGTVTDDKGKRLLYIDEIQSDWHQKALEQGYATKDAVAKTEEAFKKLPEAYRELDLRRGHILNALGVDNVYLSRAADGLAALMLIDPNSFEPREGHAVADVASRLPQDVRERLFGIKHLYFGANKEDVANALQHYHQYTKQALGENYQDAAHQLNSALETHTALNEASKGKHIPDAPWKGASDYGKLVMKRVMRIAADHDYDGVALGPGWVQYQRWGEDHRPLYDNVFGNTFKKLASEHGMEAASTKIPLLESYAKERGRANKKYDKPPYAKVAYFTPESREKVKKGFSVFKRGGMVEPHAAVDQEKAKRRALMVAREIHKADGGAAEAAPSNKTKVWAQPDQPTRTFKDPQTGKSHVFAITPPDKDVNTKTLAGEVRAALDRHLSLPYAQQVANSKAAVEKLSPYVGKDSAGGVKPFLTMNAKLEKASAGYEGGKGYEGAAPLQLEGGVGVKTIGLPLSPAYQHGKYKVCANSASCKENCLGQHSGKYSNADWWPQQNSLNKTHAFLSEPGALAVQLHNEIKREKLAAEMQGNRLAVRMNVLSDTDPRVWEPLIKAHPDVDFYDYTKMNYDPIAPNHHYTYSSTGVSQPASVTGLTKDIHNPHQNWKQMRQRLDTGSNVAMVFTHSDHLPHEVHDQETGKSYRVIDGTTHDYRPLDKQPEGSDGVIIGLRNLDHRLGRDVAAEKSNGFMVHYDPKIQMAPNKKTGEPTKKPAKDEKGATIPTNRTVVIAPQGDRRVPHNLREARASGGSVGTGMPPEYAFQQFHNFNMFDEPNEGPSTKIEKKVYAGPVEGDISSALALTRRYVRS